MIFIRCLIENPSFDSQTKDSLTTAVSRFGSQCVLPESFLKKSFDDGLLVKDLLEMMERKARKQVLTPDKGHFGKGSIIVRGLDDAHYAGTNCFFCTYLHRCDCVLVLGDRVRAKDCTLVITEGESAKALAVAGKITVWKVMLHVFIGNQSYRSGGCGKRLIWGSLSQSRLFS